VEDKEEHDRQVKLYMEKNAVISVKKPAGDHITADHKNEKEEKQNPDNKYQFFLKRH